MDLSKSATEKKSLPSESRGRISKTVIYYAAFIALGLAVAAIGPTLPSLAEHTGARLSEISFLFTAHSMGYLLGSLLGGRLYDRIRGHPVMGVALSIMTIMMVLVPLMSLLWILNAVLLIVGMAAGTLDVGANTLLVWIHGRRVGPFMNGLHFFFGLGAFLSPIIIALTVRISGDIFWAYWALSLVMFPVAVLVLFLQSPRIQTHSREGISKDMDYSLVALIASFFFLHVGAEFSFGGWIYTYAVTMNLASKTVAAYLTSAFWGSLTLGRLLAIPIASRIKPRSVLLGDLAGCLLGGSVILLWSRSSIAAWAGTIIIGLSIASIFPTTINFTERNMTITGKVMGWFFVGASLGGMILPWLIGQLFETVGPQVTMFLLMLDFTAALGLLLITIKYTARHSMH